MGRIRQLRGVVAEREGCADPVAGGNQAPVLAHVVDQAAAKAAGEADVGRHVLTAGVLNTKEAMDKAVEVAIEVGAELRAGQRVVNRRVTGVAAVCAARWNLVVVADSGNAKVLAEVARDAGLAADESVARLVDLVKACVASRRKGFPLIGGWPGLGTWLFLGELARG